MLSTDIFLLFPRETGERGWNQVTGTSKKHTPTHTHTRNLYCTLLGNRFNYSFKRGKKIYCQHWVISLRIFFPLLSNICFDRYWFATSKIQLVMWTVTVIWQPFQLWARLMLPRRINTSETGLKSCEENQSLSNKQTLASCFLCRWALRLQYASCLCYLSHEST